MHGALSVVHMYICLQTQCTVVNTAVWKPSWHPPSYPTSTHLQAIVILSGPFSATSIMIVAG